LIYEEKKKLKTKKNPIEQYKKIISKDSLYLSIGGMIPWYNYIMCVFCKRTKYFIFVNFRMELKYNYCPQSFKNILQLKMVEELILWPTVLLLLDGKHFR
jgi:hypothetical protein